MYNYILTNKVFPKKEKKWFYLSSKLEGISVATGIKKRK
jgi:hypothetical protein